MNSRGMSSRPAGTPRGSLSSSSTKSSSYRSRSSLLAGMDSASLFSWSPVNRAWSVAVVMGPISLSSSSDPESASDSSDSSGSASDSVGSSVLSPARLRRSLSSCSCLLLLAEFASLPRVRVSFTTTKS